MNVLKFQIARTGSEETYLKDVIPQFEMTLNLELPQLKIPDR